MAKTTAWEFGQELAEVIAVAGMTKGTFGLSSCFFGDIHSNKIKVSIVYCQKSDIGQVKKEIGEVIESCCKVKITKATACLWDRYAAPYRHCGQTCRDGKVLDAYFINYYIQAEQPKWWQNL